MTNAIPENSTSTAERPARWYDWFTTERLSLLIVVLASAMAMSPNVADPDLWGHVQFGRDVFKDGQIAPTNSYSFTAEGYRWINHENLSEIVMAWVADGFGPLGLVFGKFLLSLFVILAIFKWSLREGSGLIAAAIVTLLVAANLGYHWSIRPQLSSFAGFTLLIILLQYSFRGWRDRWHLPVPRKWFEDDYAKQLSDDSPEDDSPEDQSRPRIRDRLGYQSMRLRFLWLAPVLFVIWANSHGGFVAGICTYVAYLGIRLIEALFRGGRLNRFNTGWGIARRMALMAFVAVLATFINPYGPNLQLWLIESLGSPRPEISDWSSSELFTGIGLKFWLMIGITAFALMFSKKKKDAAQLAILGLLLWQSLSHFRHVPFFAIAAGFWIGPHLQSAMARFSEAKQATRPGPRATLAIRLALGVVTLLIAGNLTSRLSDLQVCRNQFPVDAIDFMRKNELHGRVVVTYDWAQYAIAALCTDEYSDGRPKSQVAFDGRFRTCYPQSIVDMHFDFLYGNAPQVRRHRSPDSPPIDPARVLGHLDPNLVLLRRFGERTEQHMTENSEEWTLLYQDAIAQIWGRRAVYDNVNHPQYLPDQDRILHDRLATDSVTWPAITSHPLKRAERISNPRISRDQQITLVRAPERQ